jgi:PAS domain S-box-containing protein
LVDDRLNNLISLKALLSEPGYNIVLAQSGAQALAQVSQQEFALIVMDVAMPAMDGFETATRLKQREQSQHIPIIFVTAQAYQVEKVFRAYHVGAVDYLSKPIDGHAMQSKVANFVELYRQRKSLEKQAIQLREAELREQRLLRQQAEDALRESEALYQLTFEEAPLGIGHASAQGEWIRVNRRLGEILGMSPGALVGRPIVEIGARADRAALADALAGLKEGGDTYAGEHRLAPSSGGGSAWAAVTFCALPAPGGSGLGRVLVVAEDISERKQLELERAQLVRTLEDGIRDREDFLLIAAHELKTPITPLRLQAQSLLHEATKTPQELPADVLRKLNTIDRSTVRLEKLIDRLLDVSRLTAGELGLNRREFDLEALVRQTVDDLLGEAQRAGCEIVFQGAGPVIGQWDRLRVQQTITNLLGNAIKYGRAQPVEISVSQSQGMARICVRDHGIGIPEEAQKRIFHRFVRLASVRHFGGFGLGLWISRHLVEAHGGQMRINSRPGQGSEFIVELPLTVPLSTEEDLHP